MAAGQPLPGGVMFGPTVSGKMYLSLYIHRGSWIGRSQWIVEPQTEFNIFGAADNANWRGPNGHYWGVHVPDAGVLGARGERLAKFPQTSNAVDPWHGYPVSPLEDGDRSAPPDDLVELWRQNNVVSKTFARRIQRRKV
jgi:hypothetical protein